MSVFTHAILIKPLSVNEVWKGRRYKTKAYQAYETEMLYHLPKIKVPQGDFHLTITAGFSNRNADLDNCAKPFIDILQKKYGFNDNRIYKLSMIKKIVNKGAEFIAFNFREMGHNEIDGL